MFTYRTFCPFVYCIIPAQEVVQLEKNKARRNICGEKIRYVRMGYYDKNHVRITQNELVARLQSRGLMLERITISRIEQGIRPVSDIELVYFADALKVPIQYFFKDSQKYLPGISDNSSMVAEE